MRRYVIFILMRLLKTLSLSQCLQLSTLTLSSLLCLCQDLFFTPESDVFTLDDSHRDTLKSFFVLFVAADFIDLRTQQHNIWIFIPCLPLYARYCIPFSHYHCNCNDGIEVGMVVVMGVKGKIFLSVSKTILVISVVCGSSFPLMPLSWQECQVPTATQ